MYLASYQVKSQFGGKHFGSFYSNRQSLLVAKNKWYILNGLFCMPIHVKILIVSPPYKRFSYYVNIDLLSIVFVLAVIQSDPGIFSLDINKYGGM